MNRLLSAKPLVAAAVALGALVAGTAAHARSDVVFSIGVNTPYYVQPAPVYVQPSYGYVQSYVQPAPVYIEPQVYGYSNYYDQQRYWNAPRHVHRAGNWDRRGNWDRDGDGVPNRYDRAPNNPYRR